MSSYLSKPWQRELPHTYCLWEIANIPWNQSRCAQTSPDTTLIENNIFYRLSFFLVLVFYFILQLKSQMNLVNSYSLRRIPEHFLHLLTESFAFKNKQLIFKLLSVKLLANILIQMHFSAGKVEECKKFFQTLYKFVYLLGTYLKPNVSSTLSVTFHIALSVRLDIEFSHQNVVSPFSYWEISIDVPLPHRLYQSIGMKFLFELSLHYYLSAQFIV